MVYKVPSTIVRGYCTLFLINIDLWSGGGLPIDRSPWIMDGGLVVGLLELVFGNLVCVYFNSIIFKTQPPYFSVPFLNPISVHLSSASPVLLEILLVFLFELEIVFNFWLIFGFEVVKVFAVSLMHLPQIFNDWLTI